MQKNFYNTLAESQSNVMYCYRINLLNPSRKWRASIKLPFEGSLLIKGRGLTCYRNNLSVGVCPYFLQKINIFMTDLTLILSSHGLSNECFNTERISSFCRITHLVTFLAYVGAHCLHYLQLDLI